MAAGEWHYVGVEQVQPDDGEYVDGLRLYRVEAHRPLPVADSARELPRHVRARVLAQWTPGEPEPFDTFKITVDSVTEVRLDHVDGRGSWTQYTDADYAAGDTIPADSDLLRGVPLRRMLIQASRALTEQVDQPGLFDGLGAADGIQPPDYRELRKEWPRGDKRTVARWAAHLYSRAVAAGDPATKAVEDAFGVSKPTARRMVKTARELGFLADDVVSAPGPLTRKGSDDGQGTSRSW